MTAIVDCTEPLATTPDPAAELSWLIPDDADDAATARHAVEAPVSETPAGGHVRATHGPAAAGGTRTAPRTGVTAIVPVYNERGAIVNTVNELHETLSRSDRDFEIILVNDGSTDGTQIALREAQRRRSVRILHNDRNRGYGFSIKRAVSHATFDTIVITDADGTYPIARINDLLGSVDSDMVVGSRNGLHAAIPLVRRPAKWCLRKLAEYLTATPIPDLNSGLRVIKRSLIERFLPLLPDGFSFTTTITLAALTHGYAVRYVPIDYARRVGRSSIRPIRDTLNFLSLIVRTVLYFRPLKVFMPLSACLLLAAVGVAVGSKLTFGLVADVTTVTLVAAACQMFAIGLLADLIEKRSPAYAFAPRTATVSEVAEGSRVASPPARTSELHRAVAARTQVLPVDTFAPARRPSFGSIALSGGYAFAAEPPEPVYEGRTI